ncbi:hypothetical protein [Novosphingobium sp.]|uniref:hypothetical protein n=1 Tax=Novosphingobium sp. TaxID=1874826 RepID=UPI0025FC526D|nr:hypothetical protein [Novosphingobium sp.]MCC6924600.1 hypothetical protein [Novosphingobium sp.]
MAKKFDMAADNRSRANLLARLEPYWKMEAGNAIALPLLMFALSKGQLGWVSLIPMSAMVMLLVIGALYWRGKVRQLRGKAHNSSRTLEVIDYLQERALVLTLTGCATAVAGWLVPGLAVGTADKIAASVSAVLALLEYINYYHRQLQHFDNKADFRRLLAGKGFRQSWMARDLAAWRAGRSA